VDVLEAYGDAGLGVFQGGSADVRLAMIRNNGIRGINLSNGGALLMANSTVQNNTGDGLGVFNGSSALLIAPAVTITGNTGAGVNLFDGASADIQFASITLNGGRGISASTGSKLRLLDSTVSQHPNDGVGAFDGASVLIQCAFAPFPTCATGSINTISQNNFNGVNVATGSTGVLQGVTVSGTTGNGVRVDTNATLRLQTASTVITGNHRRGIEMSHASIANVNSPPSSVTGNGGPEVICPGGAPSFVVGNISLVTEPISGCLYFP